jgi:hypothetical protein
MELNGLHLLLTYQCTFECEHCFAWGSPWQSGVMTLEDVHRILSQAKEVDSVRWIFFEGGEPFLYYPVMLKSAQTAHDMGFQVGIVSNSYWATSLEDAIEWLRPFAGLVEDLSVSSDLYHYSEALSKQAHYASEAAHALRIPVGYISVAQPQAAEGAATSGKLPTDSVSGVMYRGRAAVALASRAEHHPWEEFAECPYEDLRLIGRFHVDPFGYLHICQGIVAGNLFSTPLRQIVEDYNPEAHPIVGPLLAGGPAELVRRYDLSHNPDYADACHLCYEARQQLRQSFPHILTPDQMYGVTK